MYVERPAYKITRDKPGSDLAAESSAALSASSLAFERFGQSESERIFHAFVLRSISSVYIAFRTLRPGVLLEKNKESRRGPVRICDYFCRKISRGYTGRSSIL